MVDPGLTLKLLALRALLGWASACLFLWGGLFLGTTWTLPLESRRLILGLW